MREIKRWKVLPIQFCRFDVEVCRRHIWRLYYKCFTVFEIVFHLFEKRRPKDVNRQTRSNLVKTARTEHIPGRHLTTVLVSDQTVGFRLVELVHDLANKFLRFPWLASII